MRKGRLLIASTDIDIVHMLRLYFQSRGYEVIVDTRSKHPAEACAEFHPDILIWDTGVSDTTDLAAYHALADDARTAHIRIGLLVRRALAYDLPLFFMKEPKSVFTVPFDVEAIRRYVEDES